MKRLIALAGLTFLAALPSQASADSLTPYTSSLAWEYQCALGDFSACVSISMRAEYDPTRTVLSGVTGATRLTVGLTNHQGSTDWLPDSGAWGFMWTRFHGLETDYLEAMSDDVTAPLATDGLVTAHRYSGDPQVVPIMDGDDVVNGTAWETIVFEGVVDVFGQNDNVLYGCDYPDLVAGSLPYFNAGCGSTLFVTVRLLPGHWKLTKDTQVEWGGYAGAPWSFGGERVGCTTGVDCVSYSVPEPAAWLIITTGLLGLGFIVRRRSQA